MDLRGRWDPVVHLTVETEENQQRMLSKTLSYLSHHAIAILALVCSLLALAGASYAATQLPKNSVGNAQIQQGAVSPPKFSSQVGGYVRMFAVVNAGSKLQYSFPQAKLSRWGNSSQPGGFSFGTVSWKQTVTAKRLRGVRKPPDKYLFADERRRGRHSESARRHRDARLRQLGRRLGHRCRGRLPLIWVR